MLIFLCIMWNKSHILVLAALEINASGIFRHFQRDPFKKVTSKLTGSWAHTFYMTTTGHVVDRLLFFLFCFKKEQILYCKHPWSTNTSVFTHTHIYIYTWFIMVFEQGLTPVTQMFYFWSTLDGSRPRPQTGQRLKRNAASLWGWEIGRNAMALGKPSLASRRQAEESLVHVEVEICQQPPKNMTHVFFCLLLLLWSYKMCFYIWARVKRWY